MGVFSSNSIGSMGLVDVPMAEGYSGPLGCATVLIEATENDMAMFGAIIASDFHEQVAIKEGASVGELNVLTEGVAANIWARIKELLTKFLAKIKAIVAQFIAKFDSIFMKDNKALVAKYEKAVLSKIEDVNKMEVKYSKETGKSCDIFDFQAILSETKGLNSAGLDKADADIDSKEYENSLYAEIVGQASDAKNFAKDFHEVLFAEEEVQKVNIREVMGDLKETGKIVAELKKKSADLNSEISKTIKTAEKLQKEASDVIVKSTKENEDAAKLTLKIASVTYRRLMVAQTVLTKYLSCLMGESKFTVKQNRRVFTQAVSYKHHGESVDLSLLEAVGEVSDTEVEMDFEEPTSIEVGSEVDPDLDIE